MDGAARLIFLSGQASRWRDADWFWLFIAFCAALAALVRTGQQLRATDGLRRVATGILVVLALVVVGNALVRILGGS